MKQKLEVGHSAEVYECVTDGGYGPTIMPVGHWSIGVMGVAMMGVYVTLPWAGFAPVSMRPHEIRRVGKLTVTKLK